MAGSFQDISGDIIRDSIKSAIFIDDKVLLPFEEDEKNEYINHSDLISSFENHDCSLSYYRYSKEDWESKVPFLFENRDLLILDWELSSGIGYQNDTLKLLEKAIQTPSLHFCIIYTETEEGAFDKEIVMPCLRYFSFCTDLNNEELTALKEDYIKHCEEELGVDGDELFKSIRGNIEEIVYYNEQEEKVRDAKRIINREFTDQLEGDVNTFRSFLNSKSDNMYKTLISLLYAYEEVETSLSENTYKIRVSSFDGIRRLYINNTIILIGNKDEIRTGSGLYEVFKTSLIEEHNIFLSLLGLEIRNLFRSQSGFIGKDLDDIDETAFFYHHRTIKPKHAFYEFLRELWIDQSTSIFNDQKLKLYSTIDEYKSSFHIEEKVADFEEKIKSKIDFQNHLIKLNNFYNEIKFSPTEKDTLSFGDVLKINKEEGFEYLVCVTPLCDCVEPDKIEKQYLFVRHEQVINNLVSALERAEGKHISFIKDNDEIICVDWGECKSFSLYVKEPKLNSLSRVSYKNKWKTLEYVGRIKENFTQRIANKALGNTARVGVSFAQIN